MLHFYHLHISKKRKKDEIFAIDTVAYVSGLFSPFLILPQLYIIWIEKNAKGISQFSFASFAFFNFVLMFYGIAHKNKLIIINNFLWGILQVFVVIGAMLYK